LTSASMLHTIYPDPTDSSCAAKGDFFRVSTGEAKMSHTTKTFAVSAVIAFFLASHIGQRGLAQTNVSDFATEPGKKVFQKVMDKRANEGENTFGSANLKRMVEALLDGSTTNLWLQCGFDPPQTVSENGQMKKNENVEKLCKVILAKAKPEYIRKTE
jgi:hypothetical protein